LTQFSNEYAVRVWVEKRTIFLELVDDRIFRFPADGFKILSTATDDELKGVQLELNGSVLRWEKLDEDIKFQASWPVTSNYRDFKDAPSTLRH
jgi:hypothetical protein